eukprot:TRINITY_DN4256_c0_g1_i2.p1 TRINITY_DN4256_c0_g1~~TRINITY_DN4256_c0_g1_i2.p1  ORF type:complete len:138 (+),score=32.32 TRINITY_DN4256_c0_g1_i2:618-1031(+)
MLCLYIMHMQLEDQMERMEYQVTEFDRAAINKHVAAKVAVTGITRLPLLTREYQLDLLNLGSAVAVSIESSSLLPEQLWRWFVDEADKQREVSEAFAREVRITSNALRHLKAQESAAATDKQRHGAVVKDAVTDSCF